VVCNFYNASTDYTTAQFHSYNGFSGGATTLFVPRLVKDYYNYQSGLRVQNVHSTDSTQVTVTYYLGGATYQQTSPTLGPGQAWGPYLGIESQLPASMAGKSGSGSAIITSSGGVPIVATVNEDNRVDPAGRGITYNAFLSGEETTTVVFPQVTSKFYGYSSGIQIQNAGSGTATLGLAYSMSGRTDVVLTGISVAEGASWQLFTPNLDGIDPTFNDTDFNGSVVVTADKPIVGIANLSFRSDVDPRYGVNYGDSFTTYNGFNQ